jgi:ClpP class serine protease
MLEGLLQKMDLSKGFALLISSPGGHGMAAERIAGVCRAHSGTGEYWAIVPGKAKSAATMICFGASKILMGPTAELGPVDPQIPIVDKGEVKWFSAYNIVSSYRELFDKAVKETGKLEPYLQQLANYDAREIKEMEAAMSLSEDISIRLLGSGMLNKSSQSEIKSKIDVFLSPEKTKAHGRPIYGKQARDCDLAVKEG